MYLRLASNYPCLEDDLELSDPLAFISKVLRLKMCIAMAHLCRAKDQIQLFGPIRHAFYQPNYIRSAGY